MFSSTNQPAIGVLFQISQEKRSFSDFITASDEGASRGKTSSKVPVTAALFLRRKSVPKIHKQNEYSRWNIFTDMTDVDFFQDFFRKALVVYISPLQQLAFRILTRCNGEPENLVFHRSILFVHRKSREHKRTHLVDKYRPLKGKEGLYLPSSRYRFHTW